MIEDHSHGSLGVISFGMAFGITAAFFTLLIGISTWLWGWGIGVVEVLSTLFIGYRPTPVGAIAGAVWAFFDGLIAGIMVAWLYNRLLLVRRPHRG